MLEANGTEFEHKNAMLMAKRENKKYLFFFSC